MHKMEICYRERLCRIQPDDNGCYYPCAQRNAIAVLTKNEYASTPFAEDIRHKIDDAIHDACTALELNRTMCPETVFSDPITEIYETEDDKPYAISKNGENWNIHLPNGKDIFGELQNGSCMRDNYFLVYLKFDGETVFDNSNSSKEQANRQNSYPKSRSDYKMPSFTESVSDTDGKDDADNTSDDTFAKATDAEVIISNTPVSSAPSYKDYKFDVSQMSSVSDGFGQLMATFGSMSFDHLPDIPATPVASIIPPPAPPASPFTAAGAQPPATPPTPPVPPVFKISSADYFKDPTQFQRDVAHYIKFKDRKTGFANLDAKQPFYPGLITIGAVSSLGKTTFLCQLAENLAMVGEHVLYFSLEQSPFQLLTKSIARRTYDNFLHNPSLPHYSSIQIRRGDWLETDDTKAYVLSHLSKYCSEVEDRITVANSPFSLTVEGIKATVENYIQKMGVTPTVVVDYLQIVAATVENNRTPDTRTAIDHIVHELKILQLQYDLTILLVSALNRANYMNTIDMESFRESSGIEYTSDMIIGLELEVLAHDNIFNTDATKKISQKRLVVQMAKACNPRDIAYVVLKNRDGLSNYRANFKYYPAYDMFMPCETPTDLDLEGAMPGLSEINDLKL